MTGNIRRLACLGLLVAAGACSGEGNADATMAGGPGAAAAAPLPDDTVPRRQRVEHLLDVLAADSMEGRRTATPGAHRAAHFLAGELQRYGVTPAGDSAFIQHVPLVQATFRGRTGWRVADASVDLDTVPPENRTMAWNVVGVIPGADPELQSQVVQIAAHYDHLGIGRPVNGDSIYNGADDDASGSVAVLEMARALARGEPPARTVVVVLSTGEEMGLLGTRWYIEHPVRPLGDMVADLEVEMIGRPDSLAGGPGRGWLTGYSLSTMGDILAEEGSPIIPDPRPDQNFFRRSDNIAFARLGIPAHTLSSFNLHTDYHRPSDEVDRVDFDHMTAVIDAAVAMVRQLASGPIPEWHAGHPELADLGLRGPFDVSCDDGATGSALFVEGPPPGAWLTLNGRRRLMPQVEAADGARYQQGDDLFWLKGDSATVALAGANPRQCHMTPPPAAPPGG